MISNFYTVKEVAEKLKIHIRTVYRFIKNGELKAFKFGKEKGYRISEEDLESFIKKHIIE